MNPVDTAQWELIGPAPPEMGGTGAAMRQVHIKAGHVAARHSHAHEQFFRVLSGGGELKCEAGTVALLPGTAIRFAPGAWHSAEFTADTVLLEFNLAS